MPNIQSSKKRMIQSSKKRKVNTSKKSMLRTFIKKVHYSIQINDKENIKKNFIIAQSIIDRFASKGLIHKNKAARYKSNLFKKIKSMH